ncbi:MAG: hypothetical protein RR846_01070 [Oscillospiraceae bacterium]
MEFTMNVESYNLGKIAAFCEIVERGAKNLGLSDPMPREVYETIAQAANDIAIAAHCKWYLEKEFLKTDIVEDSELENKYVILYYSQDWVIDKYLRLKHRQENLEEENKFTHEEREYQSKELYKLLSYPTGFSK